jgi:TRAP-type uncharacterized transport system fused permease subunit
MTSGEPPAFPSDEAPPRELSGATARVAAALAAGLSLYGIYWVLFNVQPQVYRVSFLVVALVLTFLRYPARPGATGGLRPIYVILIVCSFVAFGCPLY